MLRASHTTRRLARRAARRAARHAIRLVAHTFGRENGAKEGVGGVRWRARPWSTWPRCQKHSFASQSFR